MLIMTPLSLFQNLYMRSLRSRPMGVPRSAACGRGMKPGNKKE